VASVAATPVPADPDQLSRLLSCYPPELSYIHRRVADRLDPARLLPGIRTVIVACRSYGSPHPGIEALPPGAGFVSRFAWCPDYHGPMQESMNALAEAVAAETGCASRGYSDTGPILEKAWAARAGLGFVGRNGLLVHPRLGSFVFLGVVLTAAEVLPDEGPRPPLPGCGFCYACLQACPTGALRTPGRVDVRRCLAHLTVTFRDPVPHGIPLAGHLYGCDRCQDVCPYVRKAFLPDHPCFRPLPGLPFLDIREVLRWDESDFQARLGDTPVRRRGLAAFRQTAERLLEG
jgi:epoxyqueuosine reductase